MIFLSTCRRQRQEDQEVKARLGYIMKLCLPENRRKEKPLYQKQHKCPSLDEYTKCGPLRPWNIIQP